MVVIQRVSRCLSVLLPKRNLVNSETVRCIHKSASFYSENKPILTEQKRYHHQKNLNSKVKSIDKFIKSSLESAKISPDNQVVTISFVDGSLQFPTVWLRDNCRCDVCFDHLANSRIIDQLHFKPGSIATSVKIEGESLKVNWSDGHVTLLDKQWLCQHSFEADHQHAREQILHEERIPWDAKRFNQFFQKFSYDKVMSDDETLLNWLVSLARNGLSLVEGAPQAEGTVQKLAEKIAFVRRTLYGEIFHVKSQPGATNTAYKQGQLQMHSDMPFYHHMPGTIFLHCIIQSSEGGDNLLTDGINAAKQLTPEEYRTLADTVINWSDVGSDKNFHFHSINREPVICEDKLGNIRKVNWSQPQRDPRFDVSIPEAIKWYHAMKRYSDILHDPSNAITFKMQPGDILTLDNRRVMHSRANYSDGARQLNGVYVDWDEIYPKIRVLRKKLNKYD